MGVAWRRLISGSREFTEVIEFAIGCAHAPNS